MDRLDYLIFALKKNGIYVYFDMLTYRRFREGDGVENTKRLADSARPQSNFDEHLIELQKEFCEQIWTHVNPYTQLAYKDDPVIVMSEIEKEKTKSSRIANSLWSPIARVWKKNTRHGARRMDTRRRRRQSISPTTPRWRCSTSS